MLAATCLLASSVYADSWHKEYALTGKPELRITTGDANIHVTSSARQIVDITVTTERWKIGEHGFSLSEHQTGNRVVLEAPTHGVEMCFGNCRGQRIDIEVRLPRDAKLDLRTHDGNIEVHDIKGEIQVRTGDGHQMLDGLDGTLDASSGDGRIEISGRFDVLRAHSGDGRIDATAKPGSKMAQSWSLRAGDGSIRLRIPKDLSADVQLHTGDGHISLDVPLTVQGRMLQGQDIEGKLNGGGPTLELHTGDGSIHLEPVSGSL